MSSYVPLYVFHEFRKHLIYLQIMTLCHWKSASKSMRNTFNLKLLCLFIYCRLETSSFGSTHVHLETVQMEWDSWRVSIDDCFVLYNTLQRNQKWTLLLSRTSDICFFYIQGFTHHCCVSIFNNKIYSKNIMILIIEDICKSILLYINGYWSIFIHILFKFQTRRGYGYFSFFLLQNWNIREYICIWLPVLYCM